MTRLDRIDAGQAAVTDLVPVLETILARSIEDRDLVRSQFATVATIAGFAHAAATGNAAPLPDAIADDTILEQFLLTQPPDLAGTERALVEWRKAAGTLELDDLSVMLGRQYQPSATDSAETRMLRYRLAAITRAEIEGRGGTPPAAPATIVAEDRSIVAREKQWAGLARIWRAGESAALFAEPELAGALDRFAQIEREGAGRPEAQLALDLAELHRDLADRIEAGDRPAQTKRDPLADYGNRDDHSRLDRPDR